MIPKIVAIEQRVVLATGVVENVMVIELSGGRETRASISEADAREIIGSLVAESNAQLEVPTKTAGRAYDEDHGQQVEDSGPLDVVEDAPEDALNWSTYFSSDSVEYQVLRALNIDHEATASTVRTILEEAAQKFGIEAWRKVLGPKWHAVLSSSPAFAEVAEQFPAVDAAEPFAFNSTLADPVATPPPNPAPQPAAQPPTPSVTWEDGTSIVPRRVPSKTVPHNSHGYPIIAGVTAQEAFGYSDHGDEDGVASL